MKLIRLIDYYSMKALNWATSTKDAFYILSILIIAAVFVSPPNNLQGWLLVIVTEFYQGVALPGIGAAARKEGEETRRLLQETHDTVMAEVSELKEIVTLLHEKIDGAQ